MPCNVCDEITYPSQNLNDSTIDIHCKWILDLAMETGGHRSFRNK